MLGLSLDMVGWKGNKGENKALENSPPKSLFSLHYFPRHPLQHAIEQVVCLIAHQNQS